MSDGQPQTSATQPLAYAQRPRLTSVGRHWRWLIVMAVGIAIAIPIYRNWQPLKHRVLWLYWSGRAAMHVMPGARTIATSGPEATRLATTNPDYLLYSESAATASPQPSAVYRPVAFRELAKLDSRLQSMDVNGLPIIFMGTLHRPDGTPRLVIIAGNLEGDPQHMLRNTSIAVLAPPRWFDRLPKATGPPLRSGVWATGNPPTLATYEMGAADPKNASRIIIPYVVLEDDFTTQFKTIGQGEVYADLGNDDALSFTIRGFGGLGISRTAANHSE